MEAILQTLSRQGTFLTRFYQNKPPGRKLFSLRLDSGQIVLSQVNSEGGRSVKALVDIGLIKEIRQNKNSRDFERSPNEAQRYDKAQCFVIHYGTEFVLTTISCAADSEEVAKKWVKAIQHLMKEISSASYINQVNRWLRMDFHGTDYRVAISLPILKKIMYGWNYKISDLQLREIFRRFDPSYTEEIHFQDFATLYNECVSDDPILRESFPVSSLAEFRHFLEDKQGEKWDRGNQALREYMKIFQHKSRSEDDEDDSCFTLPEFLGYLFSTSNSIWDSTNDDITQDMGQPMNHYWIASSHNTYSTGNALTSLSSVEAYARCLRMGCRCVELDTFDGPDGMPLIYHKNSLTSRIRVIDVVKCIKEHAFVTSDYPVILSIEQKCSLPQQKIMAQMFQKEFGDLLLTQPFAKNETFMPSPEQLKKKIIIKHTCKPEEQEKDTPSGSLKNDHTNLQREQSVKEMKQGMMHLYTEDQVNGEWVPYLFYLSSSKLCYMNKPDDNENTQPDVESSTSDNELSIQPRGNDDSLHFREDWFYGRLENGREDAEIILRKCTDMPDGTFLVRDSERFIGDFSLSLLFNGDVKHARIRTQPAPNRGTIYYLVEGKKFDSLSDLIAWYRSNSLRSGDDIITLDGPARRPQPHETKEWFKGNITGGQAENILRRITREGLFLVRKSDTQEGNFVISFRGERQVKHCRIARDGRLFVINATVFETLVELVEFYESTPLYRKVSLRHPLSRDLLIRAGIDPEKLSELPANFLPILYFPLSVSCLALCDYRAKCEDELSFSKGDTITNVVKQDGGWWLGDCNNKVRHKFISHPQYVKEINLHEIQQANGNPDDPDIHPLLRNSGQRGSFELTGSSLQEVESSTSGGREFVFRLQLQNPPTTVKLACESAEDRLTWMKDIKDYTYSLQQAFKDIREYEQTSKCAKEITKLCVYCRAVKFRERPPDKPPAPFREMSSFSEQIKYVKKDHHKTFLKYNKRQFSRIYPMGARVTSTNYDPTRMWNVGCQLVAMNYQTPDNPMFLNQARFRQNGSTGYVLQPKYMRTETVSCLALCDYRAKCEDELSFSKGDIITNVVKQNGGWWLGDCNNKVKHKFNSHPQYVKEYVFNPFEVDTIKEHVDPILLTLTIIAGRNLVKSKGLASPFIEVEIIGADYDYDKYKTDVIQENGFNPTWDESHNFHIHNPDLAIIRFIVKEIDVFGEANFIGQAAFPVGCIRSGYRSIQLKNGWGEELTPSALLVKIKSQPLRGEDPSYYGRLHELRHEARDLSRQIEELSITGDEPTDVVRGLEERLEERLHEMETQESLLQSTAENQQTNNGLPTSDSDASPIRRHLYHTLNELPSTSSISSATSGSANSNLDIETEHL